MLAKKWLVSTLSCAVFALSACGGQSSSNNTPAPASSAKTENNAASSASTPTNNSKTLRVGMNAEFAPFEFLDNQQKPQGFDVDLVSALAQQAGFTVEFKHTPWDSLFPALNNRDIDIVASAVTITEERKATMDFSDPYYTIKQVVLVPKGKNVANVDDLKKLNKVGVVSGNTGDFAAQKIFGATSNNVARFKTVTLLLKEVESGGLDAAISDSAVVGNYVKNNSDKGFTIIELPDFETENYGIVVRKGDTETLNQINAALKTLRENGEYDKIEEKYFAKAAK